MRYFKYQNDQPMSKVWSLFADLGRMSKEQKDKIYGMSDYSHTLEIVRSALNGNIPLTEEAVSGFNLGAYEIKCRLNEQNGKFKEVKDKVNIIEFDNSEDDVRVGFGDVSDRKLSTIDDSFEEILNDEEFESNIRLLLDIRSTYIVEHGIDLVSVLLSALKGIPEAIKSLKSLMSDSTVADLVKSLCSNSHGDLLPRLEAVV